MITIMMLVYVALLPLGAALAREAFSDSESWCWASRRARAEVMAAGAVIWPILLLIVLAGGFLMLRQTMMEEQP
jgi:hypothetical protein